MNEYNIFLKNLKFKYICLSKKFIKILNQHNKKITDDIINYCLKRHMLLENSDKNKIKLVKEIFFMIVEEIAQNENEQISNLKFINYGHLSDIYSLGNKIIKVGDKRFTPRFPNNPYIIKPLLRREFSIDEKHCITIEICERCKTNCCTKEDVYYIYKSLRQLGLVWTDPALSNIGKLTKNNCIHWHKKLNPSNKALMLDNYRGNVELKAGDLIICDADCIYDENDCNVNFGNVRILEKRYQSEKNKKLTQ